jgi:lipopolysaccharide transport system ATP-binding protein
MKRAEIRARFKKIVEFAGVEEFLDTPVKRYSSGMYLRLAFAVAAHLDAEILLMDEVLAVGDAAFQQRSLGKMQDLARDGRAVLLVSHQLQAIQTIASRAILLEKGKLTAEGAPAAVVARYLGQQGGAMDLTRTVDTSRLEGWFTDLKIGAGSSQSMQGVAQGEPWTLEFGVETKTAVARGNVCVSVWNASGQELFSHNWIEGQPELELAPGRHRFGLKIPTANLMPGPYWVSLHLAREQSRWICEARGLGLPPVLPGPKTDPLIESRRWGVVYIPCQWEKRA